MTAGSSDETKRRRIKVVAFGGGHGLAASLRGLRNCAPHLDLDITAVVTVGDNGGSSGRLRAERDAQLPPGDLRMALAALAGDDPGHQRTVALMQHRFALVGKPDRRGAGTDFGSGGPEAAVGSGAGTGADCDF
ncbi:2-phospho-L-lactate transferase CofD family protein, partial [Actinoplanes sp. NPDC048791]|uniref:gluconeogenesis factor YvcK family protein n=1 Tax=Actinoplanes sp. NPDC048791 TaxID=3154623 RepID=UPI0033E40574